MNAVVWLKLRALFVSAVVLFLGTSVSLAQQKRIHLRNEIISTQPPAATRLVAPQNEDPVSGIFLIQFTGRSTVSGRETLSGLGVELLVYVPEDAFVARLRGAKLGQLRAQPFVQWVGEYRPDHKLHASVAAWLQQPAAGPDRRLSLLLSPKATAAERAAVERSLQTVEYSGQSRFAGLLRGRVSVAGLRTLALSPAVLWIEPAPNRILFDEVASKIVAGDAGPNRLYTQSLGYDGRGVTVSVADTGIDSGDVAHMHPDIAGRVTRLFHYGNLADASDGHSHGTHCAGIIAGNGATGERDENGFLYGLGVAPGVSLIGQRIFDADGLDVRPPSNETLTRDAVRAGADIGSNSWGDATQGRYDISAAEFDGLVRDADSATLGDQPYILEFSAGNSGPGKQTIGSPAVGKNVIATGASENDRLDLLLYADGIDAMADFSSRGPCEDGRIKPDVVAPGTWISSLKSSMASEDNAWAPISDHYIYQGGTSQAGPHVAGAAALFVQYFKELTGKKPSPAMVKAALINSAVDMDDSFGTSPVPNNDEGWGRVDQTRLIRSPSRGYDFLDQTVPLTTGQAYERRVVVMNGDEELRVTLTYTDVPGFPGAVPALVNDLDLEVVGPDGVFYRGNQYFEGASVENPFDADSINNVEGVTVFAPRPGEYLVRVRARNVPQDALQESVAVDQDFALIVSASLPEPGQRAVFLDRGSYTAPSAIRIAVLDPSKSGQSSLTVTARSGTELAGETLTLRPSPSGIVFTGIVATLTGTAVLDGRLQIADRDTITVSYGAPGSTVSATARGDLVAPVILGVGSRSEFVSTIISWTTDEPSSSILRYGISGLSLSVTNLDLVTEHSFTLKELTSDKTYKYEVTSIDEAGNSRTSDSTGTPFHFIAPHAKTLLLVDDYGVDSIFDSVPIPLSSYTNALVEAGVSFDVWERQQRGAPSLRDFGSYRAVMWRINDMDQQASITQAEVSDLATYLATGGAFCMFSMEALSRFGSTTFQSDIAHVASFTPDAMVADAKGAAGDPVADGLEFLLNYQNYPDLSELGFGDAGPDFSDHVVPGDNALPFLIDSASSEAVGIRYPRSPGQGTGRTLFVAFPLDGTPGTGTGLNTRAALLHRAMAYLAPGADGATSIALDNTRYTLTSRMVIEAGDSDLAGDLQMTVQVVSGTDPQGISVKLAETKRLGFFRGTVTLVHATDAAGGDRLRAKEGDLVRVQAGDGSANNLIVSASAIIDTVPPKITSSPVVDPDFEVAFISWDSSEAADSLVEFGESPLLGRTEFSSVLGLHHELVLSGLVADKLYYYRVTSRDQAGNAEIDDNAGTLYTFRTLNSYTLPWADDMEMGIGDWTIEDADLTEGTWVLGVPHNGWEAEAHSPTKAWGSNIDGGARADVESRLISPPLNLSGGNRATLRFWHSYNFLSLSDSDILNQGEVELVTSTSTQWISLGGYAEDSSPWVEEKIDLTPYVGQVVYIAFHFTFSSFDSLPRAGWLIDDVSVSMELAAPGTLTVTNTLAQARFVITGPTPATGQGRTYIDTNAAAGEYVITYSDVPYYNTPAPQTNSLSAGAALSFRGVYTFADTNKNGISDAWEQAFFGAVAPSHPASMDSDQDGRSDMEEFLSGTDPNKASSALTLRTPIPLSKGDVLINWASVAGYEYRLLGSSNLQSWAPASDWVSGRNGTSSYNLSPEVAALFRFVRIEVRP